MKRMMIAPTLILVTGGWLLAAQKEIQLFNGKDLTGWTYYLKDAPDLKMSDVWTVDAKKGILICKGEPFGYLRTEAQYTSYRLRLEWRWATEKAGNSGVFLRVTGPDKIWPKCLEAQLGSGSAGDVILVGGTQLEVAPERADPDRPRVKKRITTAERPVGKWNKYEITFRGDRLILKVNGKLVNEGWGADVTPGSIALQSEGGVIQFRNIRLTPIE
jgi:hypothetical protein